MNSIFACKFSKTFSSWDKMHVQRYFPFVLWWSRFMDTLRCLIGSEKFRFRTWEGRHRSGGGWGVLTLGLLGVHFACQVVSVFVILSLLLATRSILEPLLERRASSGARVEDLPLKEDNENRISKFKRKDWSLSKSQVIAEKAPEPDLMVKKPTRGGRGGGGGILSCA